MAIYGSTLYATDRLNLANGVLYAYNLSGTPVPGWVPVTTYNPWVVATDSVNGNVFVGDGSNGNVSEVNPSSTPLATWSAANPNGIALDSSGNVYVTDNSNLIVKYTNSGTQLTSWNPSGVSILYGIAIYGSTIYVGSTNMVLSTYSLTGTPLNSWSIANTGFAIAFDSSGDIYVGGSGSTTNYTIPAPIQKFSSSGVLLAQWGSFHTTGLALDSSNNIYVSDSSRNEIFKFSGP